MTISSVSSQSNPSRYGLPVAYLHRETPLFDDMEQLESRSFVWQPDVYPLATMLGQAMRSRILIDLGCGRATKLQDASRLFQVIGADTRENISWCREHLDYGKWVVADLESDQSHLLNPDEAKHAI